MSRVDIIPDADNAAIAAWIEMTLSAALGANAGDLAITVPGGSTPFPIFAEMARGSLDWRRIEVWPGDDRIVPEDHPASNVGRIRAALEPAGAKVVSLTPGARPPRFALAWLGMGEDGHIASLFPSTDPDPSDPLPVRTITPDPLPPEAPFDRITLTIPSLLASDALMFVIRGEAKRAVFAAAREGRGDTPVARLLREAHQEVTCFS